MPDVQGLEATNGTKVFVASGLPATEDLAGFEALDWKEVKGAVSFGEWGDTQADIAEPTLSENRNIHVHGSRDGGEVELVVQHRDNDEGAQLLKDNDGSDTHISFKKLYKSGDAEYGYGLATSPKYRPNATNSVRGFRLMARMNSGVTEATAEEIAALA